jgi:hypothetical protein
MAAKSHILLNKESGSMGNNLLDLSFVSYIYFRVSSPSYSVKSFGSFISVILEATGISTERKSSFYFFSS